MKWMPVREFLRGGYRTIDEPTVIANHGRPVFTVFPHGSKTTSPIGLARERDTNGTASTTVRSHLPTEQDL